MNSQGFLLDETIRTLPSDIIENIIWRLPTEEIVRSSILSKEWRYNWTKITKVVFSEDLFGESIEQGFGEPQSQMKEMSSTCKLFNAISQFLLLHQGPIVDFTLDMWAVNSLYLPELDQILLHLSIKNSVKKLHLSCWCDMPLSIFSFHQLTDLYLCGCNITHQPTFNGFRSLTTLCLECIEYMYVEALMHILFNNPLLKSFTMLTSAHDNIVMFNEDEYVTINDLFECLPVIEHLTLCAWDFKYFHVGVVPRKLATSLVHLKYLCLEQMCFYEDDWLRFLVLMLRSSPNLEKLKLKMLCDYTEDQRWMNFDEDLYSVTMQDCKDIWLENLIELEFEYFGVKEPELDFVKLILAKSPVLKKVRIQVCNKDEKLKWLRAVLPSPCASPTVEISSHCLIDK